VVQACSLYVVPPGPWRALLSLHRLANAGYRRAHAALVRVGADGPVRRLVKRKGLAIT
jgi:hypothetical protein